MRKDLKRILFAVWPQEIGKEERKIAAKILALILGFSLLTIALLSLMLCGFKIKDASKIILLSSFFFSSFTLFALVFRRIGILWLIRNFSFLVFVLTIIYLGLVYLSGLFKFGWLIVFGWLFYFAQEVFFLVKNFIGTEKARVAGKIPEITFVPRPFIIWGKSSHWLNQNLGFFGGFLGFLLFSLFFVIVIIIVFLIGNWLPNLSDL